MSFWYLQFSQKINEKIWLYYNGTYPKSICFHLFLGELKVKFIYSEKATKFCEIFTLHLSYVVPDKHKVEILQNFVAFSENMNFI